jgi:hypothetical protein
MLLRPADRRPRHHGVRDNPEALRRSPATPSAPSWGLSYGPLGCEPALGSGRPRAGRASRIPSFWGSSRAHGRRGAGRPPPWSRCSRSTPRRSPRSTQPPRTWMPPARRGRRSAVGRTEGAGASAGTRAPQPARGGAGAMARGAGGPGAHGRAAGERAVPVGEPGGRRGAPKPAKARQAGPRTLSNEARRVLLKTKPKRRAVPPLETTIRRATGSRAWGSQWSRSSSSRPS